MAKDIGEKYANNPKKKNKLYKRTLWVVVIAQMFGGAGLAAGITVGALLAEEMIGSNALAGLPAALFTLGSAGAALIVGRLSNRFGRRAGLTAGFMAGGLGAIGVIIAAVLGDITLLFIFLFVYGAGMATNLQARYAGTDLATRKQRGTAISLAMVSTTLGAVAGPTLVDILGDLALYIGVPKLAGPFILAAVAYIVAGLILFIFLRPDPFIVALNMSTERDEQPHDDQEMERTDRKGIAVGATIMVISQMVMIAIMTMTPIHMKGHGHGLGAIGLVIGIHIGSMYFPSLITGVLVDKVGRPAMAIAAGLTLLTAGLMAALVPAHYTSLLVIALALLGLGWNFGLISGTAIIVDSTEPATRAKTQGSVDVFMSLAGASGGALSGMVVAGSSYEALSLAGGALSLVLIPVVIWNRSGRIRGI